MAENAYVLSPEDRKKFARLIAQCWNDDATAEQYRVKPYTTLREFGVDYPETLPVPLIPPKPDRDISLEELEVAAGSCNGSASSAGSASCPMATLGTYACIGSAGKDAEG